MLNLYARFAYVIAVALTFLIAVVILFAFVNLAKEVLPLVPGAELKALAFPSRQDIFGKIMTVLTAIELKRSILKVVPGRESVIQVGTVMLIALRAVARKFIVVDLQHVGVAEIYALGVSVLVLSVGYGVVTDGDRRAAQGACVPGGAEK